jgi:hypothetical protein
VSRRRARLAGYHVVQMDCVGNRVIGRGYKTPREAAEATAAMLDGAIPGLVIDVESFAASWNVIHGDTRYAIGFGE